MISHSSDLIGFIASALSRLPPRCLLILDCRALKSIKTMIRFCLHMGSYEERHNCCGLVLSVPCRQRTACRRRIARPLNRSEGATRRCVLTFSKATRQVLSTKTIRRFHEATSPMFLRRPTAVSTNASEGKELDAGFSSQMRPLSAYAGRRDKCQMKPYSPR